MFDLFVFLFESYGHFAGWVRFVSLSFSLLCCFDMLLVGVDWLECARGCCACCLD